MYKDDSLTLHTDLYQINMMQVYFNQGIHNKRAVFEVFFRKEPFANGYAVFAGLERMIAYLQGLSFSETDIAYLEELGYPADFVAYLKEFKLELSVKSAKEGDLVFANEPIVQIEGPLAQCQLVETAILNLLIFKPSLRQKLLAFVLLLRMSRFWNLVRAVLKRWMQLFGERAQQLLVVLTLPAMFVQENSLVFPFQVRMRMPLSKLMVMTMMPLWPMLERIKTVSF